MELPTLRLTVEKGPRKGDTLECKTGDVARVGRVVRGNTLAVRDPGVSQKHLAFQFLPDSSRWAVSDLDTSNGTLVNGLRIPPSAPFRLSDGDAIKIGESTAIAVTILAAERRDLGDGDGDGDEKERSGVGRRRGRPRRGAPPLPAVEERAADATEEGGGGRRGKGRSKKGAATSAAVPKKDEVLEPPAAGESVGVEAKNVAAAKGRGRRRRPTTRYAAAAAVAKVSRDEEEVDEPHVLVHVSDSESVEAVEAGGKGNATMESDAAEEAVGGGVGEESAGHEEEKVGEDMEKMTLGEWFDRMEKVLPLMINDVAEEIIASLREKAQRFDEFIAASSPPT